jgi:hypothetical protein
LYSAEGFLPPEIWEHVSIDEYLEFRLYCLEFMSLMLEQISDSKEEAIIASRSVDGIS